jgi:hypothetical protein
MAKTWLETESQTLDAKLANAVGSRETPVLVERILQDLARPQLKQTIST